MKNGSEDRPDWAEGFPSFRIFAKEYYSNHMKDIEKQALEVLHNINWLIEPHNSYTELVEVKGRKVVIRCVGVCSECGIDCIGVAFEDRMPEIKLVRQ